LKPKSISWTQAGEFQCYWLKIPKFVLKKCKNPPFFTRETIWMKASNLNFMFDSTIPYDTYYMFLKYGGFKICCQIMKERIGFLALMLSILANIFLIMILVQVSSTVWSFVLRIWLEVKIQQLVQCNAGFGGSVI
jgi:hypothetical protein